MTCFQLYHSAALQYNLPIRKYLNIFLSFSIFLSSLPYLSPSMLSLSSLRPLDVEFMSRLSKVVNIVPVIAKADTLTLEERDFFKQKVSSLSLLPSLSVSNSSFFVACCLSLSLAYFVFSAATGNVS